MLHLKNCHFLFHSFFHLILFFLLGNSQTQGDAGMSVFAQAFPECPILVPPSPDEPSASLKAFARHVATSTISSSEGPSNSAGASDSVPMVVAPTAASCEEEWLLEQTRTKLASEKIRQNLHNTIFSFVITDAEEAGGVSKRYCIDSRSGHVGEGDATDGQAPDVTLGMSRNVLIALLQGQISPTAAYMSGDITVEGELQTAMRLQALNT